jgi:hypothetical protein
MSRAEQMTTPASTVNKETSRMNRSTRRNRLPRRLALIAMAVIASLALVGAGAASASADPVLRVRTLKPDYVTPGKFMKMFINVDNVGDTPLNGDLTINYTLPSALTLILRESVGSSEPTCVQSGQVEECVVDVSGDPMGHVRHFVTVYAIDPSVTGNLVGEVEVFGGGAANSVTVPLSFNTDPIGPFDIKSFAALTTDNSHQAPAQAGSVPTDAGTTFEFPSQVFFNQGIPSFGGIGPSENPRDITVHVPPGFVGYPPATSLRCTVAQLSTPNKNKGANEQAPSCPRDSQIGLALLNNKDVVAIYNVVPPRGVSAEFGLFYQGVIIYLQARLRPGDNGIDIVSERTPDPVQITAFEATLWGVPTDDAYDGIRAECTVLLNGANGNLCGSIAPEEAFLRNPTSCGGPLPWSVEINTYQHPEVFHRREAVTPAMTGCDRTPFEPKISLALTDGAAHSTSGLDLDLSVPQENGPNGIAQADVKQAALALPQGFGLNPAAAEGLTACTDTELRLGVGGPAQCPDASKLGTVEVDTPLLDEAVGGSVYLRTQNSQDPESGQMYRLAVVLHSEERGVDVKLPGSLVVNKATGQLTTTFDELPQLPFEAMHLHLKAGPRAPLTTPQTCGNYAAQATLTGWNGKTVSLAPSFTVNQNCDAPGFAPGFQAGVADPVAGGYSPFTLRVTRGSGQPNISRIEATLPEGELAKLAGVPVCSDAQAASCPASSRIGSVVTGVGEGSSPLYLPQPGKAPTAVYLAGPYKGAPYSVIASVPAQSGPFDLGTVLVRSALRVDPETSQASVESDLLPQIYGGIPVSYRDVRVVVDRPEFTINPTSCEPKKVTGTIGASNGGSAKVSDRFQVSDCAALGFKPKLSISLAGKSRRGGNPALTAVLRMPQKGANANVSRTSVALPGSEFLAQSHIQTVCTRVQYAAGAGGGAECPKGSVYGRARAFTPLLDYPLEGPVYLRSNGGDRELPDLVASLGGQIHVDLVGYIDSNKKTGGIRTTFANVPDAPVSKFVLKMPGGKKSLLENSTNICRGKHRAIVKMDGQNGRVHDSSPLVQAKCGTGAGKS